MQTTQLTLGQFIEKLKALPQDYQVYYSFGSFQPATLSSYRGYYDHLALSFEDWTREGIVVEQLLTVCQNAIGKTYEGYKGGQNLMDENTPLWAANYGKNTNTAIVDIVECAWCCIIETSFLE